jgi:hypothetical protein
MNASSDAYLHEVGSAPADPDRAQPQRMQLLLAALPVVTILALVLGIAFGLRGDKGTMYGIALGTLALALVPIIVDQGRRPSERHILLAVFSLVYTSFYVIPLFFLYLTDTYMNMAEGFAFTRLTLPDLIAGQLEALVGLVSLLVGYAIPVGRWIAQVIPKPRVDWSLGITLRVAFLMFGVGWAMMLLSFLAGIASIIGTGVAFTLASALIYGNVLLTAAWLRFRSRSALMLLPITVIPTSLLGFFTGSKEAALMVPFMIGLTTVVDRRRLRIRWVVLAVIAIVLLYPTQIFYRDVILDGYRLNVVDALSRPAATVQRTLDFVGSSRPSEYLREGFEATSYRLDGLAVSSVIIRDTPSVSPFQYGRTFELFFAALVPRFLWPEKPVITLGRWINDVYGAGPEIASNTAVSQVGEFYLNFGTAGVIAGMFLFGAMLRLAHEVLLRGRPTMPALLATVIIVYNLVVRSEGNLASALAGTIMAIVPVVAMHFLLRLLGGSLRDLSVSATWGNAPDGDSSA